MERFFKIGVITNTHGIHGAMRVFPTTWDPDRFNLLKTVILDNGKAKEEFSIEKISFHKQFVIMKLKNIDNIDLALKYKNANIIISEKDALPLSEDEYYTRDLYDMEVYTEDGEFLGNITDISETGANDVYIIKCPESIKESELLIPAIKQCILNVDVPAKKMTVRLLKGLRE